MPDKNYLTYYFTLFWMLCCTMSWSQRLFTDVTEASGIDHAFNVFQGTFGGGAAVLDFNQDGYEDLFIAGGQGPDILYRNNKDGTFTDVTEVAGLAINQTLITQGAVSADVNRDGHIDLYVTTIANVSGGIETPRASDILYLNNGNGTFVDMSRHAIYQRIGFGLSATAADFNMYTFYHCP